MPGNSSQVIPVLRDVLLEHMSGPDFGPWYQVQSAVYIGYTGHLLKDEDIISGRDEPVGLLLTMADGTEYKLTLANA